MKSVEVQVSTNGFGGDFPIFEGTELVVRPKKIQEDVDYSDIAIRVLKPLSIEVKAKLKNEDIKVSVKYPKLLEEILDEYIVSSIEAVLIIPNYGISTKTRSANPNYVGKMVYYGNYKVLLKDGKIYFNDEAIKLNKKSLKEIIKKIVKHKTPVHDAC